MILWPWCEVRGGQGLLGLGVRGEESHFWVVAAVKEPGSAPADPTRFFLAVTYFGIEAACQGDLELNEAPSSPNHSMISCDKLSVSPGWSCPICDR